MDRIFEDITTVNRNVREKGMLLTKVFAKAGRDNEIFSIRNVQLQFGAGRLLLNFSCYLQLYIFNWAFVPG